MQVGKRRNRAESEISRDEQSWKFRPKFSKVKKSEVKSKLEDSD